MCTVPSHGLEARRNKGGRGWQLSVSLAPEIRTSLPYTLLTTARLALAHGASGHGLIFLPLSCSLGHFGHIGEKATDDHGGCGEHPASRPPCSSILLVPTPTQ